MEFFWDELKQMIDEEKEEEGADGSSITSTSDRNHLTAPSVRKKLCAALSYSHGDFGKTEVCRVALEGRGEYKEENVQQQVLHAETEEENENNIANKMQESPVIIIKVCGDTGTI